MHRRYAGAGDGPLGYADRPAALGYRHEYDDVEEFGYGGYSPRASPRGGYGGYGMRPRLGFDHPGSSPYYPGTPGLPGRYNELDYDGAAHGEYYSPYGYPPSSRPRLLGADEGRGTTPHRMASPGVWSAYTASSRLPPTCATCDSTVTSSVAPPLSDAAGTGGGIFGRGGYAGFGATPRGYTALAGSRGRERGVLRVHLKRGVGLKAADMNGKSDPYVIVQCGSESKRSKVIKADLNPVWNETLELRLASLDEVLRHGLVLKVMDKDTLTKDDPLGEISVSLDALRASNSYEYSEALPTKGHLIFTVSWEPLASEHLAPGTLHVHLLRAHSLKSMDRNGKSDPYVKLTLAGETKKSKTIKKTLDPVWDESFMWKGTLRDLVAEPLRLHAFDYDFAAQDDKLGNASVDLRDLEGGEARDYAVQLSEQGTVHLVIKFPPSASAIGVLTTVFALMLQLSSSALSIVAFAVLLLALALHPLAKGAATHEEMLQDVASALKWVRSNKSLVSNRLVFGGYSSGAHVAAALLTRPDVLAAKGLPAADKLCDGVLLLSGVLGVRDGPPLPPVDARWARQVPHLIMRLVFAEATATLPSPVHCIRDAPALPHLLIFCEHELFNLQPIERSMGIMFSSETYAAQLTARGIKVKQITVHSDHWAVLDSAGFRQALRAAFVESRWPS